MFLSELRTRLSDYFIQNLNGRITELSRANFYNHISNFRYQSYLDYIRVYKFRTTLSKLRVSTHRLKIEVGRWLRPNRTPVDDRKCRTCICNKLENEYHFLFECQLYSDLRRKYLKRYFWIRTNMLKLKELMLSTNTNVIKNLGLFVKKAFKVREQNPIIIKLFSIIRILLSLSIKIAVLIGHLDLSKQCRPRSDCS